MAQSPLTGGELYLKRHKFHKRWRKVVTALASVVVFCTTYALILPAITLEQSCPLEEHTHGESCYEIQQTKAFVCGDSPHRHTSDCYNESGQLTCGYADFYLHTHDESCYGEDGTLLCSLPQISAHTHGESCYTLETHTHGPECYSRTKGDLICTQEESPGHTHDETCGGEGVCSLEETEGHTHTDDCYEWTETLTCEIPEETWVLTCQRQEIVQHTHTESCYDGSGNLVCGKQEVLRHVHDETCIQTTEVSVLVCSLPEHIHGEDCLTEEASPAPIDLEESEPTTVATEPVETKPMNLVPTGATLSYKTGDNSWTPITGEETNIPGDADFQLKVTFTVEIAQLKAAGYQMVYSPLPDWFRNVSDSTDILDSNNESVGTMTVDGTNVLLTFDKNWSGLNQETMNGSFYVEAQANLTQLPADGKTEIKVGDTTIKVNFDGDLVAKYGEVTLEKAMGTLEENAEDGYDYFTYTLTVHAGADGCPAVTVEDSFTSGSQYVDSYILPDNASIAENGKLTWVIGDMEPNTTQTLTYKVKLKPEYLGVSSKNKPQLVDTAIVYSKGYERTSDKATFTPVGNLTLSKMVASFQSDGQGGGILTYTVWIQALPDNTYTMENAAIRDSLDGTVPGGYKTDAALLPYVRYVEDSFRLYEGGYARIDIENLSGAETLTEITPAPLPTIAENGSSFLYIVGDLKPGESRTLTYQIKIAPQAFANNNEDFKIDNRAAAVTDPTRTEDGNQNVQWYNATKTITTHKWARKLRGEKVTAETTVPMGDGESFTIPADSYQYQVVVNETGDWDVSSAVMQDNLGSSHMSYVGYLRVDAYQTTQRVNYGSDETAAAALGNLTPVKTVWLDIDGKTSFEFTPEKVGLPQGNYAYLMTYYARPQNMEGYSTVIVANQFDLTGKVGINGKYYVLWGINVSATVTLEGSNHFGAQKRFWYYDTNAPGQEYGTMYWVLKLSGDTLPQGTMLLDAIAEGPHAIGQVERAFIADYGLEFSEEQTLENLPVSDFEAFDAKVTDAGLELTLTGDVKLNGQCLYFIVSTHPTSVPQTNGTSQAYKNALSTKDPGENMEWIHVSEDQTYVVAGDNLYKYMAGVFEVQTSDESTVPTVTHKTDGSNPGLQLDLLQVSGNGTYVQWKVRVNQDSSLSGRYRITEQIPEGMEVVYIQRFSTGTKYPVRPVFVQLSGMDGYTEVVKNFNSAYDKNPATAYYYVKGQQVVWEIDGLISDPSTPEGYYAEYLVVCKVTDSDLFLSGQSKTYVNQVTLSNMDGKEIGKGSADVTLQKPTLSKTGTYNAQVNGGRYPFQIQLNELGTDLVPGADTIKLIDEMCDLLILDPNSIKVVKTGTEEAVPFTAALEGHTLTLTLPDDQPLTVTYEAAINAAPGQEIKIENNAHWEDYTTADGGSVSEDISYFVGATVDTATNPVLTVAKADQYDTGQKLSGAEFSLREMELQDGKFAEKSGGLTLTGITGEDGEIVFGNGETKLQCNVPYRLVETKAPNGYVLDDTPQYFVFALKVNDAYPAELKSYKSAGAYISYTTRYTHTALNHKGEIVVEKKFQNADGSALGKVDGTYTFGLFEEGSDVCLQTATVKWGSGTVIPSDGKAHFTNVPLGKTYRVYELDSQGKPIKTGPGVVGGVPFLVSYPEGTVTVSEKFPKAETWVTNRLNYAELPNTGGPGQIPYTIGGLLLLAAGLTLLYYQQKRRREGRTS